MPAVAMGCPGFFGRGSRSVGSGSILRQVGSSGMLNFRGVNYELAVVGKLDVGLRIESIIVILFYIYGVKIIFQIS